MKDWVVALALLILAAPLAASSQSGLDELYRDASSLDAQVAQMEQTLAAAQYRLQSDKAKLVAQMVEDRFGDHSATERDIQEETDAVGAYQRQLVRLKDRRTELYRQIAQLRERGLATGGGQGIDVISANYGANCNLYEVNPRGNVTSHLTSVCQGKARCAYAIDYRTIGDPAVGCRKAYVAEWTCGSSGRLQRASAPPEASGQTITLSCGAGGEADDGVRTSTFEPGQNRLYGDYRETRQASTAGACQALCISERQCRAWTWVRPGVQGDQANCWLKSSVPSLTSDDCCTSGKIQ